LPEGAQFRVESILLVFSEADVEILGFLVVILVDTHLAGVDSRIGVTGAVVWIDVPWGEGLDVDESSLGACRGLVIGVNVLGDNVGYDALEHLEYSFRGPGFLELGEKIRDP
jgi:hypothetical protein